MTNKTLSSNIVFLLGSGISYKAGMPSVESITNHVLNRCKPIVYNPDGYYCFKDMISPQRHLNDFGNVRRIVQFLERLEQEIDAYYAYDPDSESAGRKANYEDIYFLASQIFEGTIQNYDNPAIPALVDKITPDIRQALSGIQDGERDEQAWSPQDIAREAMTYINHVLWCFHAKLNASVDLDYLELLAHAVLDEDLKAIDFFTLNYDVVLERFLKSCKIDFFDGFELGTDGRSWWDSMSFIRQDEQRVRLLKLHGSINWYADQYHGKGSKSMERIDESNQPFLWRDIPEKAEPTFLAGTLNKMLEYTSEVFAFLQSEWLRSLYQSDVLVVCGYGGNDKGINTRIIEWFHFSDDKILIVVDPSEDIIKNARPALGGLLATAEKEPKIQIIQKSIEHTSWPEVRDRILSQLPS
ncbi:MAG: SIR2 family protein [Thermoleophilia bacterium]|nr:SIR2 family protein [Thermoleophilia bacterium]